MGVFAKLPPRSLTGLVHRTYFESGSKQSSVQCTGEGGRQGDHQAIIYAEQAQNKTMSSPSHDSC